MTENKRARLELVVADDRHQLTEWLENNRRTRSQILYVYRPEMLYGLDASMVSNIIELTDDHDILDYRRYQDLRNQVNVRNANEALAEAEANLAAAKAEAKVQRGVQSRG